MREYARTTTTRTNKHPPPQALTHLVPDDLGRVSYTKFHEVNKAFPSLLFPAFLMQMRLRQASLGVCALLWLVLTALGSEFLSAVIVVPWQGWLQQLTRVKCHVMSVRLSV
jgi:hypothetical protein